MKMKLKFNIKEFDYKQFFLKYGEWIGLAIALVITLPVLFSSVAKIFGSGSPTTNAKDATDLANKVDQAIQTSTPTPEALAPNPFVTNLKMKFQEHVDYEAFATEQPWFIPSTLEDTKRRNPEILSPGEFQVEMIRGDVPVRILLEDENKNPYKIQVIHTKTVEMSDKLKRRLKQLGALGGRGGGGAAPGGGGGMMGAGRMGAGGRSGKPQEVNELQWVDLEKIDITPDVKLAQEIHPTHMVIISASFPFKDQLEIFRRALRKPMLKDFLGMITRREAYWEFRQVDVERQVLKNGKVEVPWEPYNDQLMQSMTYFIKRIPDWEEEDPELKKFEYIINPGLVMPRPQLARDKYMPEELPGIKKTLADLKKSNVEPAKRELSELAKRSMGKGVDIWNPFNPISGEEPQVKSVDPTEPAVPPPSAGGIQRITGVQPMEREAASSIENAAIPEMALIRIVDTDVSPGYTYQYRLKVRMLNPNYKQKNVASKSMREMKDLVAREWAVVPPVHVEPDAYWYVTSDKRDNEKVTLQIHRWLDGVALDRSNEASKVPVGEWTILERTDVRRGEYIGGVYPAKVPIWRTDLAKI